MHDLDLHEIAYLCGGPERVVTVTLVALLQDGGIKISPRMHRVNAVRRAPRDPVESAVFDVIPERGRPLHLTASAVASSAALEDVGSSLRAAPVLPDTNLSVLWQGNRVVRRRRLHRRLRRRDDLVHCELGRIATLGTSAIADARIRQLFEYPEPPARVKMPRGPHRRRLDNPYDAGFQHYHDAGGGSSGW